MSEAETKISLAILEYTLTRVSGVENLLLSLNANAPIDDAPEDPHDNAMPATEQPQYWIYFLAMEQERHNQSVQWEQQMANQFNALVKAWEVAQSPFKNLLMMGFMMWMAGNTVHLFSIGITFSALWQPISALQGVGKVKPSAKLTISVFQPYKDNKVDLLGPKLLFIALNLGGLALGVWKLNSLGLLPTHASDWVSSLPPAQVGR
ncbi:unnamed protein product [Camellia sinensis]